MMDMDNISDPALKLKYNKSKLKVKLWESQFKTKTGHNPTKDDIRDAPSEIRAAYKWYWQIKIHALGQDSFLDATFVEQNSRESLSETFTASNSSLSEPQDVQQGSSSTAVVSCCTGEEDKSLTVDSCSNNLNVLSPSSCSQDTIVIQSSTLESDPPKEEMKPQHQDSSSSNIWGQHLNKQSCHKALPEKKSINRSSSFHLSEKLFEGAKLKKRNPRKSLSFSTGRIKEKSSFASSDSFHTSSESSFSIDNSQGIEDGFPVSDLVKEDNVKSSANPDYVIIKKNVVSNMQPISAVQRMLEGNVKLTAPKFERNLDQGWLERTLEADQVHSKGLISSQEQENSGSIKPIAQTSKDDSDDDFIYESGDEQKSPSKAKKEEKTRLALRPTVNVEPVANVPPQICEATSDVLKLTEKNTLNGKKRKLDAIEAAMTILKEKRKSDALLPQPKKKKLNKESVSQENKDSNDSDVDENLKSTTQNLTKKSSNSGMSKKEVLEKKLASGSINDNFVRVNIKKKVFVRGKKTMNFQKYKKQQWKSRKKELSDEASAYISRMDPSDSAAGGGLQRCFTCGDVGHFAQKCLKMKGDILMPNEEEGDESPFPSLADVEKMAQERRGDVHFRVKNDSKPEESLAVVREIKSHESDLSVGNNINHEYETEETTVGGAAHSNEFMDDNDINTIMKQPENNSEIKFGAVEPLYPLQEDGSMIATPSEVFECLYKFGHKSFRPGQEETVMRILSGLPTLVTLSTGSGKSLCYQLPAYMYASKMKCITLVVSPLVSLMDDQISGLPSFIQGAALHTGQTEKQREKVMDMVMSGKLQFLLVSPEAVVAGERKSGFGALLRSLPSIAFACIDEAHCVSQWSHNFRPSYLVLFKVLREKLGVHTILGLTATATQTAVKSIIEHIKIPDGLHGVIQDTPLPNNLRLTVSRDSHRDQALIELLSSDVFSSYKSVIVYCTRREECERLAALLRTCLKSPAQVSEKKKLSCNAEAYHAGLSSTRRKQVQTAFMSGKLRIVVATVAFGMGINKADIRSVIHFNMPSNFESYVQEVGRAGRDGEVSHCHLFLTSEGKDLNELRRHIYANSIDRHTIRKLLQRVFVTCKCGKNIKESNHQPQTSKETTEHVEDVLPNQQSDEISVCAGHEVAFSVEATVSALDLPEENITTLLCYLELYDKKLIEVLPKAYTHCKVLSYKGMKHIRDVARSCPPLAMAIAVDVSSGDSKKSNHFVDFPVVEIASAIGWDSGVVKRELMNLEWTKINGNPRRSGIKVELSDLGFRVKAPGNLSPEKLDAALDFLHDRVLKQEESALGQLQAIYSAVTSVSFSSVSNMLKACEIESHSSKLKDVVRGYFLEEVRTIVPVNSEEKLENGDRIANDVRQLVSMYRDCSFTGRAVARIFHGISSPNFPAQVWGRCRFWRAHLDSDFKLICLLATRVLLKMR